MNAHVNALAVNREIVQDVLARLVTVQIALVDE